MRPAQGEEEAMKAGKRREFRILRAAWLAAWATVWAGCSGNTTGVDNPGFGEIAVQFQNAAGTPLSVRGELEVFAADQIPALDPEPLLRWVVDDRATMRITAEEFLQAWNQSAASSRAALSKPMGLAGVAGDFAAGDGDDSLAFNLIFRSDAQTGSFESGWIFSRRSGAFFRAGHANAGGRSESAWRPSPLVRFAANLHREQNPGGWGRVYLLGTPFLATLVDSAFVFPGVPEGRFLLQLLDEEGKIFAARETLATGREGDFTTGKDPVGTADSSDPATEFAMDAGADREVDVGDTLSLRGSLTGVDSADLRVSSLWRILDRASTPVASTGAAFTASPDGLESGIRFSDTGRVSVEWTVAVGLRTLRDTVGITVSRKNDPLPLIFLGPRPGERLTMGQEMKITWESDRTGRVRLEYSLPAVSPSDWQMAVDSLATGIGQFMAMWVPPVFDSTETKVMLRLVESGTDSVWGLLETPFVLLPP